YEKGFESVVRHVIEDHAVRRPHFMAGQKDNKFSDDRINIFKKVIAENGIEFDESMLSYGEFWSLPARNATQKLIDDGNIPEAVICANDIMAINVIDVFIKAGIQVPEQVIVTGFDGIDEALLASPKLSTAGCDSNDLAAAVCDCVVGILEGNVPQSTYVIPRFSPNESCGCKCEGPTSDLQMSGFNNRFYRYQDDIRALYDISTKIQMSSSPEQAGSFLDHYITHDLCCIIDRSCFDNSRNYFSTAETGTERYVIYDSYNEAVRNTTLPAGNIVPDIEKRLEDGHPLIFNALDYMSKPFGYICYSYVTYDINEYARSASVTNTLSMGLGEYITMHYQKYLTDKITAELKVAAQMQESMLPAGFATHKRYRISASMIPAKNVGGDFYDFFQTDADHLALIMADVSGKGVPAALFMATSKLVIHERALLPGTPAEILGDVNRHICENNKMGLFITIWFGILDLETGIITYASAGHEYPAVNTGDNGYELIRSDNLPPVGALDNMVYEDLTIDMSGGGSLFIYTDGVTDVKNEAGEHLGTERMIELLNRTKDASPEDVINGVKRGISEFAGDTEQFDD
ncbi:MAG: SpoIIE family protein phosphatase, partial [Ruminiclostridium sp.]|nr:SpoIIE family protein phosphatase [Ruminiclostridium sp.]